MSGGQVYGEAFAVVPEAVLYAEVSSNAKVLWAVLQRHADPDGHCYPGRKRVAELLGVSEDTVKRAKAELVEAKLIECHERYDDLGRRTTDDVFLPQARCNPAPPGRGKSAPTVTRTRKNERTTSAQGAETGRKAGAPPTPSATAPIREWVPQPPEERPPEETARILEDIRKRKAKADANTT